MPNPKTVPHPWSDDMEEALIAQSKISARKHQVVSPRYRWILRAAPVLATAAAIAFFLLCCTEVLPTDLAR